MSGSTDLGALIKALSPGEKCQLMVCASPALPRLGLMRYDHWS